MERSAPIDDAVGVFDRKRSQQKGIGEAEDRRIRPDPQRQRQNRNQREGLMLEQHSNAEPYVLNHLVLPPFWLQPQRISKRPRAVPQQIQSGSPVELIPLGELRFAVLQLGFPLLPPARPQPTRHDHASDSNQPEPESKACCARQISHKLFRTPLPPRSGALNLAVGFNPRDGRENNLFVASATFEPATHPAPEAGFNRR